MSDCIACADCFAPPAEPAWSAVLSMTAGVFGLVTAEFLPASLLTPMADALGVTPGVAGQAVTVTAVVAFFAGLLVASATRGLDRRVVLIGFSALLVASNLLVAFAPNLVAVLGARVLLGVALGGFWSMATAITIRLVPAVDVPRALSILFSGVSAATVAAAPLGSYLGSVFGWRSAFAVAAVIGTVALLFQLATLPRLAPTAAARLGTLASVLRRPGIGFGMGCTILVFGGHFALFTYVRPYLEAVAHVDRRGLSLVLLVFGLANFVGTFGAGLLLARSMRASLVVMPVALGLAALGLAAFHGALPAVIVLVAVWGAAFGGIPVGWSSWSAQAAPDQTESTGGLIVAAVQLAIAGGAAAGGLLVDIDGVTGVFTCTGVMLLLTAALVASRIRTAPQLLQQ